VNNVEKRIAEAKKKRIYRFIYQDLGYGITEADIEEVVRKEQALVDLALSEKKRGE
jgi:hypothetical protein